MELKKDKIIYPMMFKIENKIEEDIYYLQLPKIIKDKWIELEKASKFINLSEFNLPINTLRKMLNTHLDGIIDMDKVSTYSNDTKWIKSFKEINLKRILICFSIWIEEFYIKGSLDNNKKRKNGIDKSVNKLANELISLLKEENFEKCKKTRVILFENGKSVNNEGFTLYPLKIIHDLMGKKININGVNTKLLYSSKNELITDTRDIYSKKSFISFVIKLSVQTLSPKNQAYLNIDLSIRRWSNNIKNISVGYLPTNKNCYIRVASDRMQMLAGGYNYQSKKLIWNDIDYRCFKECHISCEIPEFMDVLSDLDKYNNARINDVLVPYKDDITWLTTKYDAGVTFSDRDVIFKYISDYLGENGYSNNLVEAKAVKTVRFTNLNIFEKKKKGYEFDKELFLQQLDKSIDNNVLTIEVYIDEEIIQTIDANINIIDEFKSEISQYLNKYIGNSKHRIVFQSKCNITKRLNKTEQSKKNNLIGFENRINEINKELNKVKGPTLAFVIINDKEYYKKLDKDILLDPKYAIRCGFAQMGRLTQFITIESYYKEYKRLNNFNEGIDNKKEEGSKENKILKSGILDGFRQLGVVYDYSNNKRLKDKDIVGIHISNYKKTIYNNIIGQFPIIVRYDVENSKIYAYCDLVDKVEVPYWKLNLELAALGANKNISDLIKQNMSYTSLSRRLDRIVNKSKKEAIIIIDANGTSRSFIKGIANTEIEKANRDIKKESYKLLIKEDQIIELNDLSNISLIRIRHNNEVPSYIPIKNGENYLQTSGIYKYEDLFYLIESRPKHEGKVYESNETKVDSTRSFSHRNMMEVFPMYISNKSEEKELEVVSIVKKLKSSSIQFDSRETILPLPLHLALKSEEYLYTIK